VVEAAWSTGCSPGYLRTVIGFRLSGFIIENSLGISSTNVYIENSASYIELSGNEIRYGQDQGVFSERTTSHLFIIGNVIHDNGWNHQPGQHQSHGLYIEPTT
jgi:hypothetical protein